MYEEPKMEKLTINIPPVDLGKIDLLVEAGVYPNRTEFIRAAVRKTLDSHEDILTTRIESLKSTEMESTDEDKIRSTFGMGVMHFGKANFEKALLNKQKLVCSFIGLVVIDKNVSVQLVQKTVKKFSVYGVLKAPAEVRKELEKINKQ